MLLKVKPFGMLFLISMLYANFAYSHSFTQKNELTLVSLPLPPVQYYDNDKKLTGYLVDIMDATMTHAQIPYSMALYPWARSLNLAQNNSNVCTFSTSKIPEREPLLIWVTKLMQVESAMYSLNSDNMNISTLEEAKKHTVAVVRNGAYHQILLRHGFIEGKNLYVVSNNQEMLKLLITHPTIDLAMTSDIVLAQEALAVELSIHDFKRQFIVGEQELDIYLACNLQTPPIIIDKVRKSYLAIKTNGELGRINKKWEKTLGRHSYIK